MLSFRSGEGTIPDAVETCVQSMSLFEDATFELLPEKKQGSDSESTGASSPQLFSDPLFSSSEELLTSDAKTLVGAYPFSELYGETETRIMRPLSDLTEWITSHAAETQSQNKDASQAEDSEADSGFWGTAFRDPAKMAEGSVLLPFTPPTEDWKKKENPAEWGIRAGKIRVW